MLLLLAAALAASPPPLPTSAPAAPAPTLPASPAAGQVRYTVDGRTFVDLSPEEVAVRVNAAPDARHLVWTTGLSSWVAPRDYPPVAAALAALPPPRIKYSVDGTVLELTAAEIAARMAADPDAPHVVWRRGLPDWVPARLLPEVAAALRALPPSTAPTRLSYTSDGTILTLTPDEIAARINAAPGAPHYVWKRGMSGWLPASQVAEVGAALSALDAATQAEAAPVSAPVVAASPGPTETVTPPAGSAAPAVVAVDPAAAIRAHLSRLEPGATVAPGPPALEPPSGAGEGGVSYEPPPLPGTESEMVIEEVPPELVEEMLRREGLK